MTFDELVAEVYILTNRPDLIAETKSAIKAATLKAHTSDYYSKDIHETGVEFDTSNYRQSLDYPALISNFRTLKYIRRVENELDDVGYFFEVLSVDNTLDTYGRNKADIAYIAGRVIEIRSSVSFSKCLLGAYVLPLVTESNYSSWIAELHPFAIIYEAARVVFKSIGYDEQSAAITGLVAEEYQLLRMTGLTDVGY
jgi:hypothetical protein